MDTVREAIARVRALPMMNTLVRLTTRFIPIGPVTAIVVKYALMNAQWIFKGTLCQKHHQKQFLNN
jgi:hypothetical protein